MVNLNTSYNSFQNRPHTANRAQNTAMAKSRAQNSPSFGSITATAQNMEPIVINRIIHKFQNCTDFIVEAVENGFSLTHNILPYKINEFAEFNKRLAIGKTTPDAVKDAMQTEDFFMQNLEKSGFRVSSDHKKLNQMLEALQHADNLFKKITGKE